MYTYRDEVDAAQRCMHDRGDISFDFRLGGGVDRYVQSDHLRPQGWPTQGAQEGRQQVRWKLGGEQPPEL